MGCHQQRACVFVVTLLAITASHARISGILCVITVGRYLLGHQTIEKETLILYLRTKHWGQDVVWWRHRKTSTIHGTCTPALCSHPMCQLQGANLIAFMLPASVLGRCLESRSVIKFSHARTSKPARKHLILPCDIIQLESFGICHRLDFFVEKSFRTFGRMDMFEWSPTYLVCDYMTFFGSNSVFYMIQMMSIHVWDSENVPDQLRQCLHVCPEWWWFPK